MPFRKIPIILFGAFFVLSVCANGGAAQSLDLTAQLAAPATNDEQRARLLENRTSAELRAAFDALLKISGAPEISTNFAERERLLKLAQTTAQRINFRAGEARALFALGAASMQNNRAIAALEFYRQALALAEADGDARLQAEILNTAAFAYRTIADYEKTLESYHRALRICEELKDSPQTTHILNGIGAVYMLRGDYTSAETAHRRALSIAAADESPKNIADTTFHLAIINRLRGNYVEAIRLYQQSRQIFESLQNEDPIYRSSLSTNLRHIGGTYFLQGNLRLANDYSAQSLKIDRDLNSPEQIAYSLQFLARVRFAEKNFAAAKTLGEQVLPIFENLNLREYVAGTLAILGGTHAALGEHEAALARFARCLKIREETGSRDGAALARIGIANIYLKQNRWREAVAVAELARESTNANGNRELFWQAQTVIAEARAALKECASARRDFDAAIATIESLRGEVVGGAGESSLFFAEKVKPFQQLATMLAEENDFAGAFEYAERAKARGLFDALKFGRNQPSATLTVAERQEEMRLRGEIASLNAQIGKLRAAKKPDNLKIDRLHRQLDDERAAQSRFHTNLYAAHPDLRRARGTVKPIEAAEVADLIGEAEAVLEYLVTNDQILLFVFTKTRGKLEFATHRIAVTHTELLRRVNRFRQMLAERNVTFAQPARELFDLLVRPAAEQIKHKTALTIVPDDNLWELPFQALQSNENRYVIDDWSVAYAPSNTILRELRNSSSNQAAPTPSEVALLAFGNPINGARQSFGDFAALPAAEQQTRALKSLYGAANSRVFNGAAASETVFKRESNRGFTILNLATHAVLDNVSPLNSYILLQPDRVAGDDGKLEAWELLEMNLQSDLIVLSACETARGNVRSGEGIVGLSWSLMVAGARNVMVSQWKVESVSTGDLIVEFHRSLRAKNAPDKPAALRSAALKLRRANLTAHPFYWAGFVLIGAGK